MLAFQYMMFAAGYLLHVAGIGMLVWRLIEWFDGRSG